MGRSDENEGRTAAPADKASIAVTINAVETFFMLYGFDLSMNKRIYTEKTDNERRKIFASILIQANQVLLLRRGKFVFIQDAQ